MAKSKIPDPLSRRHLVEKDLSDSQAMKIAEAYLAEGRSIEAIDFLRKADNAEALAGLRREAVENWDPFLLRAVCAASDATAERDEWLALASAAERAGKERYSGEARRYAERGEN